jgi:hypothetical protein
MLENCVGKCEFQEFNGSKFYCNLYEISLNSSINNECISVFKCDKCINEGIIGSSSKDEFIRKMKQHLGWLMDSFYSLKDDMEEEVTHLYRILKELEENETIIFSEDKSDRK